MFCLDTTRFCLESRTVRFLAFQLRLPRGKFQCVPTVPASNSCPNLGGIASYASLFFYHLVYMYLIKCFYQRLVSGTLKPVEIE